MPDWLWVEHHQGWGVSHPPFLILGGGGGEGGEEEEKDGEHMPAALSEPAYHHRKTIEHFSSGVGLESRFLQMGSGFRV